MKYILTLNENSDRNTQKSHADSHSVGKLNLLKYFRIIYQCLLPQPLLLFAFFTLNTHAAPAENSSPIIINDNAAWCWFQDERAVIHNGQLYVGSVASKLGTNGAERGGNIEVARYPLDHSHPAVVNVMHDGLQDDDHNVPALLALPNNDILAIYSKHNADRKIRYRMLSPALQAKDDQWLPEIDMTRKDKITYANLFRLSAENQGKGRIYNFYRGINFNPSFDISDDNGKTWSKGQHFIANQGRPYVKYISNNKDEIHFVTTEQHPRVFNNSIYHGYLKNGKVFNSYHKQVHDLNEGPLTTDKLTKVYQGGENNVAWTVDLHLDPDGNPYTVISVQVNDGQKNRHQGEKHGDDMRYYYANLQQSKWWQFGKNSTWKVDEIAYAGSRLYDREQDYTGLAALDPSNKNSMIISTNADPVTGQPLISRSDNKRHWELYKGIRKENGKWTWAPLTSNSAEDNLRPIIPINNDSDDLYLLWMKGRYVSYQNIDTKVMMQVNPKSL
ncbi:MAG: BNR-4 repeat-containing protein [Thalassotalea sp.]